MKPVKWRGLEVPLEPAQVRLEENEDSYISLIFKHHTSPAYSAVVRVRGCEGRAVGEKVDQVLDEALARCIHNLNDGLNVVLKFVIESPSTRQKTD